jgi:hypothetical protein
LILREEEPPPLLAIGTRLPRERGSKSREGENEWLTMIQDATQMTRVNGATNLREMAKDQKPFRLQLKYSLNLEAPGGTLS